MGVKQNHESLTRRQTLACLLVFANELEKAKRISKAGKGLLKGRVLFLYIFFICLSLLLNFGVLLLQFAALRTDGTGSTLLYCTGDGPSVSLYEVCGQVKQAPKVRV